MPPCSRQARLDTEGLSVAWDGPSHTLQLSGKLLPEAGQSVEARPHPAPAPVARGGGATGAALAGDDLDLQRQLAGEAPRDIPVELLNVTKDEL